MWVNDGNNWGSKIMAYRVISILTEPPAPPSSPSEPPTLSPARASRTTPVGGFIIGAQRSAHNPWTFLLSKSFLFLCVK